ncbi:hypothetical protein ACFQV6_39385 [Actinoplanes sp. GCM10030250]
MARLPAVARLCDHARAPHSRRTVLGAGLAAGTAALTGCAAKTGARASATTPVSGAVSPIPTVRRPQRRRTPKPLVRF